MTTDSFPYAPWATDADLPTAVFTPDKLATVDPDVRALGYDLASTILFNMTRQRWPGIAQIELWPSRCCGCRRRFWFTGTTGDVAWCDCSCVSTVDLERRVLDVVEVRIDDEVIDAARYELQDSGRTLVWIPDPDADGPRGWPTRQRLNVAAGDEGTWSVTVHVGKAVPDQARKLAALFGWELALSMTPGAQGCRLSKKTRAAVRRGASQQQPDPAELIAAGITSLPEVDQWLGAINGGQANRRAKVRVPGRGRRVHTR